MRVIYGISVMFWGLLISHALGWMDMGNEIAWSYQHEDSRSAG